MRSRENARRAEHGHGHSRAQLRLHTVTSLRAALWVFSHGNKATNPSTAMQGRAWTILYRQCLQHLGCHGHPVSTADGNRRAGLVTVQVPSSSVHLGLL